MFQYSSVEGEILVNWVYEVTTVKWFQWQVDVSDEVLAVRCECGGGCPILTNTIYNNIMKLKLSTAHLSSGASERDSCRIGSQSMLRKGTPSVLLRECFLVCMYMSSGCDLVLGWVRIVLFVHAMVCPVVLFPLFYFLLILLPSDITAASLAKKHEPN